MLARNNLKCMLSSLLRITASDFTFGLFKLFFKQFYHHPLFMQRGYHLLISRD